MHFNSKKSFVLLFASTFALTGLLWGYSHTQSSQFRSWKGLPRTSSPGTAVPVGAANGFLSQAGDVRALVERDRRRGRSPAFVPGTAQDVKLKAFVERTLADPKLAAAQARLKEYFPDTSPVNLWIRAAMTFGTLNTDAELSPENFESIGKVYAQILDGDESAVSSLQTGLSTLPSSETAFRQQAFRMLSDIGLKNHELRDSAKGVFLAEATRAGNHSDGALAYTFLLRMNPTKEWYQEVSRTYENLHPGSDLSDFVSLNVANL